MICLLQFSHLLELFSVSSYASWFCMQIDHKIRILRAKEDEVTYLRARSGWGWSTEEGVKER
jgi:hypothetical protein